VKILYLHGLGSSGESGTAQGLTELGYDVISPTYRPEFEKASLDNLVQKESPDLIIGTSMGGYYALKLAEYKSVNAIAINPCFNPKQQLKLPAINWKTGELINFTQEMLEAFAIPEPKRNGKVLVVTGINDDLINPNQQIEYCRQFNLPSLITDWGHRVGDIGRLQKIIEDFAYRRSK